MVTNNQFDVEKQERGSERTRGKLFGCGPSEKEKKKKNSALNSCSKIYKMHQLW